jgi:hypothetical protein
MSTERTKQIAEARKNMPMDERQVVALERIADALDFFRGEIVSIRTMMNAAARRP